MSSAPLLFPFFLILGILQEDLHIQRQASRSHKERVKDFNAHLNSLSEHYDIPKVPFTLYSASQMAARLPVAK